MNCIKKDRLLAKPAPIKGKTITNEVLYLITSVYEDGNFSM